MQRPLDSSAKDAVALKNFWFSFPTDGSFYQVELIGYAAGSDHLYLVYEYVQNGSLSEHLHDPLLKGK